MEENKIVALETPGAAHSGLVAKELEAASGHPTPLRLNNPNVSACTEIPPEFALFNPNGFNYLPIPPNLYAIHSLTVQSLDRMKGTFVYSISSLDAKRETSCAIPTGINGRADHRKPAPWA